MKIIVNQEPAPIKIEVGDVVKGWSTGNHYLVYKMNNGRFNALDLETKSPLLDRGYYDLNDPDFVYSFDQKFLVKAKDVTLTLGGQQ